MELRRQLEHEHSLRMRLEARMSLLETRSADERTTSVTDSCDVGINEHVTESCDVGPSCRSVSTCVDEDGRQETVGLHRGLEFGRSPSERLEERASGSRPVLWSRHRTRTGRRGNARSHRTKASA